MSNEESSVGLSGVDGNEEDNEEMVEKEAKPHKIQIWSQIRPSLAVIEEMMSSRVKNNKDSAKDAEDLGRNGPHLVSIQEAKQSEDSDDEFYDVERSDPNQEMTSNDGTHVSSSESFSPLKEELECLVHGGLPMALRGEVHQVLYSKLLPLL